RQNRQPQHRQVGSSGPHRFLPWLPHLLSLGYAVPGGPLSCPANPSTRFLVCMPAWLLEAAAELRHGPEFPALPPLDHVRSVRRGGEVALGRDRQPLLALIEGVEVHQLPPGAGPPQPDR